MVLHSLLGLLGIKWWFRPDHGHGQCGQFPLDMDMMHKTNGKIISSNRPNWWEKSPKYENTTFREYTQMYVSMKKVKLWNICETQLQVSISWVALYSLLVRCCSSPWWHLHLSPPYDVLDHASHIFSESLSSGDDIDWDEDLQKDKYKDKDTQTQTKIDKKWVNIYEFTWSGSNLSFSHFIWSRTR